MALFSPGQQARVAEIWHTLADLYRELAGLHSAAGCNAETREDYTTYAALSVLATGYHNRADRLERVAWKAEQTTETGCET